MKNFKEFFTGGDKVKQANRTIDRISNSYHQTERDKKRLNDAKTITRRHTLKLIGVGAVGATATAGLGISGFNFIHDRITSSEELLPDREKADSIREQISKYEDEHKNEVNDTTLNHIYDLCVDLYNAEFGRKSKPKFYIVSNEYLKSNGDKELEVPEGYAGGVLFTQKGDVIIPVFIATGKPEKNDPEINKLSVMKMLILHELCHAQTLGKVEKSKIKTDNEEFTATYRRGFKWVGINGTANSKGWSLEEFNAQYLADYLNDPTGKNKLSFNMVKSPVYSQSLSPEYIAGEDLLKQIYTKLGISVQEIEKLHYNADIQGLLNVIENKIKEKKITLSAPISSLLLNMDKPVSGKMEIDFKNLNEVNSKL